MDRVDESLVALRRIVRAVEFYGDELAQAAGVTPTQFRVMQIVTDRQEITPKRIAARMRVSQATISVLLDRLEAKAMIERRRSDTDRRQINIHLTIAGRRTVSEAPNALQQRFVQRFEALRDWEQAQILAILERVAAMLDAEDIQAAAVLDLGELQRRPEIPREGRSDPERGDMR